MTEEKIDYNLYEIYEDGRVYSKYWNRFLTDKSKPPKNYIENQYKTKDGKQTVCLRHRVVWYYFNGRIPESMEIDHIIPIKDGGDPKALSNLRIVTHTGNMNNEYTKERLRKANIGENNPMYGVKLTNEQKRKIGDIVKKRWAEGLIDKNIPVDQIDLITREILKTWESATDCERQTEGKFKQSGICYAAKGGYFDKKRGKWHNITQYKGYIWKYRK